MWYCGFLIKVKHLHNINAFIDWLARYNKFLQASQPIKDEEILSINCNISNFFDHYLNLGQKKQNSATV